MFRIKPSFIVLGTQKGGTTSLYNLMAQHPHIMPAKQKEIHFFDWSYAKGLGWYLSQFPYKTFNNNHITGEATPYYLYHPLIPERIQANFPKTKFIVLLRNPITRAYSHYNMSTIRKKETLSFEDAIAKEPERLKDDIMQIASTHNYQAFNHRHFSYVDRGIYHIQLKRWFKSFPREQFYINQSESFFKDPNKITNEIFVFLGLKPHPIENTLCRQGEYAQQINPKTYKKLSEFYKPQNEELFKLLNTRYDW